MLNCIHACHVSNNLNGVKPQSHGCHNHEIHQQKMSSFFLPCRCTSSTQALKNCEETNSRGSGRTGLARLKEEVERKKERKKEEKESEENWGKSGFSTDNGAAFRQGFRAL